MNCLTCNHSHDDIEVGMRVTLSAWEQNMLGKKMVGTVVALGHLETIRRHTAKVKWDSGHKDQWWPVNMLYSFPTNGTQGPIMTDKPKRPEPPTTWVCRTCGQVLSITTIHSCMGRKINKQP